MGSQNFLSVKSKFVRVVHVGRQAVLLRDYQFILTGGSGQNCNVSAHTYIYIYIDILVVKIAQFREFDVAAAEGGCEFLEQN